MRIDRVNQLYTVQSAAKALGVSQWTLLRRIRAGELSAVEVGRSHLVVLDEARATIKRRYTRRGN